MRDGYKHIYSKVQLAELGYANNREHRLVYENHYKCCILKWTDIHHINGIKDDNRIENLEAISRSKHGFLSSLDPNISDRICDICHSNTSPQKKIYGIRPHWYRFNDGFICHKCYMKLWRYKRHMHERGWKKNRESVFGKEYVKRHPRNPYKGLENVLSKIEEEELKDIK